MLPESVQSVSDMDSFIRQNLRPLEILTRTGRIFLHPKASVYILNSDSEYHSPKPLDSRDLLAAKTFLDSYTPQESSAVIQRYRPQRSSSRSGNSNRIDVGTGFETILLNEKLSLRPGEVALIYPRTFATEGLHELILLISTARKSTKLVSYEQAMLDLIPIQRSLADGKKEIDFPERKGLPADTMLDFCYDEDPGVSEEFLRGLGLSTRREVIGIIGTDAESIEALNGLVKSATLLTELLTAKLGKASTRSHGA